MFANIQRRALGVPGALALRNSLERNGTVAFHPEGE